MSTKIKRLNTILGLFVVFLIIFSIGVQAADWVQIQRILGGVLRDVTYGGNQFVAVGDAGLIMTSPNGLSPWTKRYPGTQYNLYEVVYSSEAEMYVAVGHHSQIYSSPDGISWTKRHSVDQDSRDSLTTVAYGDGLFVAAGVAGRCLTSPDGMEWTERSRICSGEVDGLAYGNGIFIAGSSSGDVYKSTDGLHWNKCNVDTGVNNKGVAYADGVWVVGGGSSAVSAVYYSKDDGATWTKGKHSPTNYFMDFDWTSKHFIACGNSDGYGCSNIMASLDGVTWVRDRTPDYSSLLGCASSTSRAVAVGTRTLIISNTTGGIGDGRGCGGSSGPSISVTSPKGGEFLKIGTKWTVTWTSNSVTDPIRIKLSTDGGTNFTTVADNLTNTGSYTWTVPNVKSTNCLLKVLAINQDGLPAGISASTFQIGETPVSSGITVTAPGSGAKLSGGSTYTIKWTSTGVSDPIRIRLSTDGGTNYDTVITSSTPNTGSYNWTVPNITASNCKVKVLAFNAAGSPYNYSSGVFSIAPGTAKPTITFAKPTAGENVGGGCTYNVQWTSSAKFDYVQIELLNNGVSSSITTSAPDNGSYAWNVPNITVSGNKARLWIKGYSATNGNNIDYSEYFNIQKLAGTITVTSPNGGESWPQSSTQTITWTHSGSVSSTVNVFYSTDSGSTWKSIVSGVSNSGTYQWAVPSDVKSDYALVKIADTSNSSLADSSDRVFSLGGVKQIVLNKSSLNFGYVLEGAMPGTQSVFIRNTGSGTLNWSATSADATWIKLSPSTGNGDGYITVSIDPAGLSKGTYTGHLTVNDPNAVNSPQSATVTLKVGDNLEDNPPFGDFSSPADGASGVAGSLALTGWALDDVSLDSVKLYRVANTNGDLALIGEGVFIEGARPDVEQAYPDYPNNTRAGWGYMMLSNFLPDGQVVLKAIAKDKAGHETVLGTKTITIDNSHAKNPFGAIDTPTSGGDTSGTKYRNSGWVLTPLPNRIPTDGSTINVFVDGTFIGKAKYNAYREDIATLFPNLVNSKGAWAYYDLDTTQYANGIHTISWSVTDTGGNSSGIGSRYFSVLNLSSPTATLPLSVPESMTGGDSLAMLQGLPNSIGTMQVRTGFSLKKAMQTIYPDSTGMLYTTMKETDRLEIDLDENRNGRSLLKTGATYSGYMLVDDELRHLPIGSYLDSKTGIFTWQPGPGFLGNYNLVFFTNQGGMVDKKHVRITIENKTRTNKIFLFDQPIKEKTRDLK
ncbi:MAG: Ser-Thr-rich GPI-anchored membrane family protein [Candidatus Omnitrophota bacterium]